MNVLDTKRYMIYHIRLLLVYFDASNDVLCTSLVCVRISPKARCCVLEHDPMRRPDMTETLLTGT